MANYKLGALSVQEIRDAMLGLVSTRARDEAERLAAFHQVSISRIYEMTKDLRPQRKERTDKGKRKADLMTHPKLQLFAEIVVNEKVQPRFAMNIEDPRFSAEESRMPVSLGTARRYTREHGVSRKTNARARRAYRRWQAKAPLDLFQFDITGLKTRWLDVKTRRILKIQVDDKNHPNTNKNLVRLWSMVIKDDHSRFMYQRFYAVQKPTSMDVIDFLLGAFRELGIPLTLYSDNDAIIVSQRMKRAAAILDQAFKDSGGFRLLQHEPYNAQATGKVERAHQVVEEFEKQIGCKYTTPTLDQLNKFSEFLCHEYNHTVNRATGEQPSVLFRAGHSVMRVPPPQILDAAFKADLFEVCVNPDVTIVVDKVFYQLPRTAMIQNKPNPFIELAGLGNQKINVVWPPDVDFFTAILADGMEYTITRVVASADAADEFKKLPETKAQTFRKSLKATAAARKKELQSVGMELLVPGFDTEIAATTVTTFPRARAEMDPALLDALQHVAAPHLATGQFIDYFSAAQLLLEEGEFEEIDGIRKLAEADTEWLKAVFAGRSEIEDTELRARLADRSTDSVGVVIPIRAISA